MKIRFGSISYYLIAILITVMLILPSGTVVRSETMPASRGAPGADPDIWNLYTNANYINALAVEGNTLWAATSGGLVQWNISAGTYQKYHPTTSSLSNASVKAVFVGAGGKKWIGTDYYVNTIDGVTWATLVQPYQTRDIAVDALGNLWFATSTSGVKKFDGINWTTYNASNGLASNNTTAIAAEGNVIWVGTRGYGISRFDGVNWTTYTLGSGTIPNMINDIAVAPNGTKWFAAGNDMGSSGGGGGSLTKLDGSTWTSYTSANSGLLSSYVFAVAVDASNTVYAGTELGVSKFNGSTWTSYTPTDGLADRWVTSIFINGSDLWFGTNGGGISRLTGASWSTFKTTDRLPHNSISAMGTQGENVWFSGVSPFVINSFNGVTKFNGITWTDYRYGAGLTTPEVHAMAADSAGAMWFAGWDINKFDGATWQKYEDPHGNGIAYALAIDGNDKWFYVAEPFSPNPPWVSKFDGVHWSAYTTADGLVSTPVNSIAVDLDHSIWFATNNGVSKFSGSAWTTYTTATTTNGLAHNKVYAVAVDKSGNKWFGTEGGVSKLSGTTWTTYTIADGLATNSVRAVSVDSAGDLWFGTYGGGVSKFTSNIWTTYNTSNSGLASNYVYDMVITSADHKWFYTYQGVNEFYSPPPILEINHHTGAPGSFFNITGRNFTPNQAARISVNNLYVGSVSIDAGGAFTATLTTSADTDPGNYFISASYTPSPPDLRQPHDLTAPGDQTATVQFIVDAGQPVRSKEGEFSIINIPDGIGWKLIFVPGVRK